MSSSGTRSPRWATRRATAATAPPTPTPTWSTGSSPSSPPGKPVHLTDVSCGAATIADIAKAEQTPISPVQAPEGGWPAVDPQITRAKLDDSTDVVTIGVGGNSLPFGGMLLKYLEQGLVGKSCREYCTNPPEGEESIQDKLARVQDEYIEMLALVHQAAPNAKVITVGYPAVLPEQGSSCNRASLTELGSVTHADVDWLRDDVLEPLNSTIQRVSDFFGDRYVDVCSSSEGHDACQPADTKWVEGICGDAEDYWPTKLPGTLLNCGVVGKRVTLVHPNAEGHANTAAHVERAIRIALLDRWPATAGPALLVRAQRCPSDGPTERGRTPPAGW